MTLPMTTTSAPHDDVSADAPAGSPGAERPRGGAVRTPVDILVMTFNERVNLPHALASVREWAANVFVVDSGSTDGTQEIARRMGAEVVEHAWEGYARQKNWAIDNLPLASPWVFILDADEAITPELRDEIHAICSRPPDEIEQAGFYVNRYLVFMGKRIRHAGYFPSWNLRLFKRGLARYEDRPVHEYMILTGKEGYLKHLMSHEDRRGLEYYIAKHNRYSTLEAQAIFFGKAKPGDSLMPSLFGSPAERRRYIKVRIFSRLPGRWLSRFVWMYVFRLGILDGLAGLRFCLLIASYELFTSLKLKELEQRAKTLPAAESVAALDTSRVQLGGEYFPLADTLPADVEAGAEPAKPLPETTANAGRNGDAARAAVPAPALATAATVHKDPSPWTLMDNVKRVLWMFVHVFLFRPSFHNWYGWRRFLLRRMGAKVGDGVRIRPSAWVEMPWNLAIGDRSIVGDRAILYSLGKITIGRDVVISQYAHLCAGTHDYTSRRFPLLRLPITVEDGAWVAADAFVGPNVTVGARSVIGARASAFKDVPPDTVVGGSPARYIKPRELHD
jgi:acetyltransferase-like isoleucine patch superfamily enzyme/glycosyltransferase involved in cell wall biosynthesis